MVRARWLMLGLALVLASCSDGTPGSVRLSGAVGKGPFVAGSTVLVSALDSSGAPTGQVYVTATSNDYGEFSVELPAPGLVALESTGFHYDEVWGQLSRAQLTLRAFFSVTQAGDQHASINAVTHLTHARIKRLLAQGLDAVTATTQAETELRAALAIGPPGLNPGTRGADMSLVSGNTLGNAYLFAVSVTLLMAVAADPSPDAALQELLNAIDIDLADDGAIEPAITARLHDAQAVIDPEAVMGVLAARLAGGAAVPDLNLVLDQDFDGVVNADDNCRRAHNPDQADRDSDGVGDACGCGDGVLDPDEACDDGNTVGGDGCSADCRSDETCGNGVLDPGEECDDGATVDGDGCRADCTAEVCGDGVCDAGETLTTCPEDCGVLATNKIDVLFMIDNSNSMEPKQASLNQYFPDFIQALENLTVKPDLHLGIVTSDLGAGQFTPPSCDTVGGDGGMLQNSANGTTCAAAHLDNPADRFLTYAPDGAGGWTTNFTGNVADAFACYASVGTGGCAFEHQLASVRAALDGCASAAGCTQRHNAGFFRQDAYLAVILLTDEDDCSAPANSTLFDPTQTSLTSALGPLTSYRCFEFGNLCDGADPGRSQGPRQGCVPGNKDSDPGHQLTPTAQFATFLKALKPQAPRMSYVSVIAAPPAPVAVGLDTNGYPDVQPSCSGAIGSGDPATRLTELVGHFDGDRARFNNVCSSNLQQALQDIASDLTQLLTY